VCPDFNGLVDVLDAVSLLQTYPASLPALDVLRGLDIDGEVLE